MGSLVLVIALAKIIGLGSEHTARGSHIVLLLVSPVSFRRILVIIPLLLVQFSVLGSPRPSDTKSSRADANCDLDRAVRNQVQLLAINGIIRSIMSLYSQYDRPSRF